MWAKRGAAAESGRKGGGPGGRGVVGERQRLVARRRVVLMCISVSVLRWRTCGRQGGGGGRAGGRQGAGGGGGRRAAAAAAAAPSSPRRTTGSRPAPPGSCSRSKEQRRRDVVHRAAAALHGWPGVVASALAGYPPPLPSSLSAAAGRWWLLGSSRRARRWSAPNPEPFLVPEVVPLVLDLEAARRVARSVVVGAAAARLVRIPEVGPPPRATGAVVHPRLTLPPLVDPRHQNAAEFTCGGRTRRVGGGQAGQARRGRRGSGASSFTRARRLARSCGCT